MSDSNFYQTTLAIEFLQKTDQCKRSLRGKSSKVIETQNEDGDPVPGVLLNEEIFKFWTTTFLLEGVLVLFTKLISLLCPTTNSLIIIFFTDFSAELVKFFCSQSQEAKFC